jgi:hypothetical protein
MHPEQNQAGIDQQIRTEHQRTRREISGGVRDLIRRMTGSAKQQKADKDQRALILFYGFYHHSTCSSRDLYISLQVCIDFIIV